MQPGRGPEAEHGPATGEVECGLALRPVVEGVVPQAVDATAHRNQHAATAQRGTRTLRDPGGSRQVNRHDAPPPRTDGRDYVLSITHMLFR